VRAISLLPGSALVVQYLRRALDTGHPVHAARALAYEAFWRVLKAPNRSHDALFEQSRALAEATSEPALIAEVELMRGFGCLSQYRFRAAPLHLWRAHDLLLSQCPGEPWLLTATRMQLGTAWMYGGNFQEILRYGDASIDEARARDDRYAVAAIAGLGAASVRHAMRGDLELALAEVEQAMAPWPNEPFATNHFGAFISTVYTLSCEPGPRLLQYIDGRPELEHASLMRTPTMRFSFLVARLRGLLLAIDSPCGAETAALVLRANKDLRALARIPGTTPKVFALAFQAFLHHVEGNRETALACLAQSAELGQGIEHGLVDGIRYAAGLLEGGESGRATCEGLRARVRAEGWSTWQHGVSVRLPGNLALLGD
jgi:hypothetical protein